MFLVHGRPAGLGCDGGVIAVDEDADADATDERTPTRPPFLFGANPPINAKYCTCKYPILWVDLFEHKK